MLIVDLRSIQSPVYYTQLYKCTHCTDIGLFSFSFPPQYIYTESYLADLAAAASVCCASGTAVLSHLLFCPVLFDRPSFRYFYDFLLYRRVYKRYTLWAIVITRLNACVCVIIPLSPRSISLITRLGGSTKGPCWVGNSI